MDKPIHEGDDTGRIREDLAPFRKGSIGRNDGGFLFVSAADDLEQEIGVAVTVRQISDLVDDQ